MNKTCVYRLLLLCGLALLAFPAAAQTVKLGYINALRLEREARRPQQDAERLKQEFAAREQEMRDLHAKVTAMQSELERLDPSTPAAEIERKRREFAKHAQQFEQTRRNFLEDLERRKAEERQKFVRDITAVVDKIAKARNLDIVVQEAVYASRAIDITDQVLKALDGAQTGARK